MIEERVYYAYSPATVIIPRCIRNAVRLKETTGAWFSPEKKNNTKNPTILNLRRSPSLNFHRSTRKGRVEVNIIR